MHEFNPMLGHRGCRLAITSPEIYDMQTTAVIEAAILVSKKCPKCGKKHNVVPEIMIPLVATTKEFAILKEAVVKIVEAKLKEAKIKMNYKIGTMIEVPRAALLAADAAAVR